MNFVANRRLTFKPGSRYPDANIDNFIAATLDGSHLVTVSATEQLNQHSTAEQLAAFNRLRQTEEDAVCAALK